MNNSEAIEQLKWVKKRISNITYSPESFEALNLAIKALEDATPIESITTKGGMTLSLKKPDIEIPDFARCIASALKYITFEEFANKYNKLIIIDNNSGKKVTYFRVDNGEEKEND